MSQRSLIWPLSIIAVTLLMTVTTMATPPSAPVAAPLSQYYPPSGATPTSTAATTATASTPTVGTTATVTTTVAVTATAQATPTTAAPAATRLPTTPSPTATLAPDEEVLSCVPGETLHVEGTGPPNAALLLYFNGRAVGGTVSNGDGFYSIPMEVAALRNGNYPIEVQVRGTREVVRDATCRVDGATPTPTLTPNGPRG